MFWNAKNGAVPVKDTVMRYVSFGHGTRSAVILPGLSDGLTTVKGKALLLALPYGCCLDLCLCNSGRSFKGSIGIHFGKKGDMDQ